MLRSYSLYLILSYLLCLDLKILKGNVAIDSLTLSVRKYAPTKQNTLTYYKNTLLYRQATSSVKRLINP